MYNMNDILAALQNGEDPEVIAQSFADTLNAAIAENEKQEAAKRAQIEAAAKSQEKIDSMACIIDDLMDFLESYYPEVYEDGMRDAIDAKDIVQAFDEAAAEVKRMQPVLGDLKKILAELEKDDKNIKKPAADPLADFLKSNGLI